jgi:hypothetical protein
MLSNLITSKIKIFLVLAILSAVAGSSVYVVNWYDTQMEIAFETGKDEIVSLAKDEAIRSYEEQLEQNTNAKVVLEKELQTSKAKVSKLERLVLVDHDLDRLLQVKPGLILRRVNTGTTKVLSNLEEESHDTINFTVTIDTP